MFMAIDLQGIDGIFEGQPPQNTAFSNQNKGHLSSRYMYDIYVLEAVNCPLRLKH